VRFWLVSVERASWDPLRRSRLPIWGSCRLPTSLTYWVERAVVPCCLVVCCLAHGTLVRCLDSGLIWLLRQETHNLISLQSDGSTWRDKINDDCYRKEKEVALSSGLRSIYIDPRATRQNKLPAGTCSGTGLPQHYKGQLWLISFFRQLLTTKVTTAQWFCGSITPTEELPRSLSAEETLNLNTLHSPTKMRVFWRTFWCKKFVKNIVIN
jgi:hypothetical protein